MYIPKHFEITDRGLLHELMRQFSFAVLVTSLDGRPFASHLPFLLNPEAGQHGTLIAHMARANEQWRSFDGESEALVIFQGEHRYITPSWYQIHPTVPTWNYMVAHAYGVPKVIDDEARVRELLRVLVDTNEAEFDEPWPMDLPDDYLHKMIRGIVMFEIPIARLEGKFKLSQNQSEAVRERVSTALTSSSDLGATAMAAMMETLPR